MYEYIKGRKYICHFNMIITNKINAVKVIIVINTPIIIFT